MNGALASRIGRWQTRALTLGIIAAVLSLLGALTNRAQFFHSYLFAWLFWVGLSLGALVIVMMQFLTGGQWGLAVKRLAEASFMTLPLMAVLFLPVLLGVHQIYSWSNGALAAPFHHKQQYLNLPFFAGRSIFYFAALILLGITVRRWSQAEDVGRRRPIAALSAGGLIAYVLCMNFASTDWVMSLDPQWYSTIFVIVFAAGQFLAALALMTALLAFFAHYSLAEQVPVKAFHDLGNMLLTFLIFWIYVSFSQFLITWSGNLPKEISWYLARSRGGWQWLALILMLTQFLLPFFFLLSRAAKRNRERLGFIALGILLASLINNLWLIAPAFHPAGVYLHWLDIVELAGIGGFWFALFFYFLKQRPLLPMQLTEVPLHG